MVVYSLIKDIYLPLILYIILSWILWLSMAQMVWAQHPSYQHYGLSEGLPSMQVYDIIQDDKGFIWFATAMGVSRFDGINFTTFSTSNGLQANSVVLLKQTIDGKIWLLSTVSNDSSYYNYIDQEQVFYAKSTVFNNILPKNIDLSSPDIPVNYQLFQQSGVASSTIITNQKQYFTHNISATLHETPQTVWIGTWGGGAFYCKYYQTDSVQVQAHVPQKTITDIFKDVEGNYWFTTLDDGVFLWSNPQVQVYTTQNGLASNEALSLALDTAAQLWVGNNKEVLSIITPPKKLGEKVNIDLIDLNYKEHSYNRINHIYIDVANNKWLSTDEGLKLLDYTGKWFIVGLNAVKQVAEVSTDILWIAQYKNPFLLNVYEGQPEKLLPIEQVNALAIDKNMYLWLGTNNGLVQYKQLEDTIVYCANKHHLYSKSINDLVIDGNNRLWMATDAHGIIVKNHEQVINITTNNGLPSNNAKSICLDAKNQLWVGTNKGLSCIALQSMLPKSLQVNNYTSLHGLPADYVNDVLVQGDSVWVATIEGLALFEPTKMPLSPSPPPIYITKIQLSKSGNYVDTSLHKFYELEYYQNRLKIHFLALSYKSAGKVSYQYQLEGIDQKWQHTTNTAVQYNALLPGNYWFKVAAIDRDGISSSQTASVHFSIATPIWQRWWCQLLLLGALTALIAGIVVAIINYYKKRNELEKRIIESEQMALRTQMNPHFIFNSLNSIQYFISQNDKKSANIYLATFATLIRKVLTYSQKAFISLEEELEYLELYLNIESLRFKGQFTYQLHTNSSLEIDEVQIPPMLIQPYVENALQHGLLQKKIGDRNLHIHFLELNESTLQCIVHDNGIGRKEAARLQTHILGKRPHIGTSNPKARLEILNRLHAHPIQVNIIDLFDKVNKKALGTRVEINIPIFYN